MSQKDSSERHFSANENQKNASENQNDSSMSEKGSIEFHFILGEDLKGVREEL